MRADGTVRVLPDLAHGVEVTRFERVVEGLVGREDGVTVVDAANITSRVAS
jgi:hypothetical protein